MTRIFLVRHGDAFDAQGLQLETYSLNEYGKIQAMQLAKRLKDNKFDAMYCSKIQRSIETCAIVNQNHNMEVVYTASLNEVGGEDWPVPGKPETPRGIDLLKQTATEIYETFKRFVKRHKDQQVIIFTHGNWIRALLSYMLADADPQAFMKFIISNTSLTIIDVDDAGFEHIITISDGAHTQIYGSDV